MNSATFSGISTLLGASIICDIRAHEIEIHLLKKGRKRERKGKDDQPGWREDRKGKGHPDDEDNSRVASASATSHLTDTHSLTHAMKKANKKVKCKEATLSLSLSLALGRETGKTGVGQM